MKFYRKRKHGFIRSKKLKGTKKMPRGKMKAKIVLSTLYGNYFVFIGEDNLLQGGLV